jgi:hypothetical protein
MIPSNDPDLDLSRIADGIERIANAVDPKPIIPDLTLEVEVVSGKKGTESVLETDGGSSQRKCVTYTVSSPGEEPQRKFVSNMSIRFLLREDPKWRVGQRINLSVTGKV